MAIDDAGTSTFLVGAFNFSTHGELKQSVADVRTLESNDKMQ